MDELRAGRFIDALRGLERGGDGEALVALFAEDTEVSNPLELEPLHGTEGARRFWRAYRDAFQEVESRFHNVVESGDAAILEWTSQGRLASGAPVEYDGVSVLEFEHGRICRFRSYFNPADLHRHQAAAGGA